MISLGWLEFTCKCGWIDWTHGVKSDERAFALVDDLRYATNNFGAHPLLNSNWGISFGVPVGFGEGHDIDLFSGVAVIPHNQLTSRGKIGMAVSIFMDANEHFEELQGMHSWAPFVGGKFQSSYYSEEDLPSDIIGFYVGYQRLETGSSSRQIRRQVQEICGAVGVTTSLNVFREVYANGTLVETNWSNWYPKYRPLTGCSALHCIGDRTWPSQFATLTFRRAHPQVNGIWWWHRGPHYEGPLVSTERSRIFRFVDQSRLRPPTPLPVGMPIP